MNILVKHPLGRLEIGLINILPMGTPKGFAGVVFDSLIGIQIFRFVRTLSFVENALYFYGTSSGSFELPTAGYIWGI